MKKLLVTNIFTLPNPGWVH